jgi:hypothetical protein
VSRGHDLEAEIVVAYQLPGVPRTPRDIREMVTSFYKLKENVANFPEIGEDDFASFISDQRAEAERERKDWEARLEQKAVGHWERRMVYVAYIEQRDKKRKGKKARKKGRSPIHHEARRQKKNFRVRGRWRG